MKTKLAKPTKKLICEAADLIQKGEVVAFPTETVYGLGANVYDVHAVAKIFEAKGRPADNPLIVHISKISQIDGLVISIPTSAKKLMKKFWPGPLTIVLKKSKQVPEIVTAGLDSVAVRMPSNKIALSLINAAGVPIAAPSANSSGKPSPTSAKHVLEDLNGRIHLVIDGGQCEVGLESTVLSLAGSNPVLLRPGAITLEQIEKVIGKVEVPLSVREKTEVEKPLSPGMKYKHYSPKAEVVLFIPSKEKDFTKFVFEHSEGKKIGIISFTKKVGLNNEFFFEGSLNAYAKSLFSALRELDEAGVELIIVEGVSDKGLGLAIMNRLKRAASKVV